jgi:hypothetical protein
MIAASAGQFVTVGRRLAGVARVVADPSEDAMARWFVYEKYRREDDLEEWRDTALPVAVDVDDTG